MKLKTWHWVALAGVAGVGAYLLYRKSAETARDKTEQARAAMKQPAKNPFAAQQVAGLSGGGGGGHLGHHGGGHGGGGWWGGYSPMLPGGYSPWDWAQTTYLVVNGCTQQNRPPCAGVTCADAGTAQERWVCPGGM